MTAFERETHDLGAVVLKALSDESAVALGTALARMPPWSVIGLPAERLISTLQRKLPSVYRFEIVSNGTLAGIVTVQSPFLHGPYLQLLAILPAYQGRNIGLRVLTWMEAQARAEEARQLWLCVTDFNTRARAFYERSGFSAAALLQKLASDGSDEILMRKRLSYGTR
jgi:ribosomal protein S18 acetylase RimI-like enzyme